MPSNEIPLIATMYDRLFSALTYTPGGGKNPVMSAATSFLQLVPSGIPVDPKDFANAFSPINPNGSLLSAEMFFNLVDPVPVVSANYSPSPNSVQMVYGEVVNGANTSITIDPSQEKIYESAYGLLNTTTTVTDHIGNQTTQTVPSQMYQNYLNNRNAYLQAISGYQGTYSSYDLTDPKQQRNWQVTAPPLQNAVNTAWNNFRSQGAAQVESAMTALNSSINNVVTYTLSSAQQIFSQSSLASATGSGTSWRLCYALPSSWTSGQNFQTISFSTENVNQSTSTSFTKFGGGTSFSSGLWNISASGSSSKESQQAHMDATQVNVSMSFGVIEIIRPWMNTSIFGMQGWYLSGQPIGWISTGSLSTATAATQLPLLPIAFIAVNNLKIQGNWSQQDEQAITRAVSGSASVGWGPFSLSGNYSSGSSSFNASYDSNSGTISVPGMQIMAWMNTILPQAPSTTGS